MASAATSCPASPAWDATCSCASSTREQSGSPFTREDFENAARGDWRVQGLEVPRITIRLSQELRESAENRKTPFVAGGHRRRKKEPRAPSEGAEVMETVVQQSASKARCAPCPLTPMWWRPRSPWKPLVHPLTRLFSQGDNAKRPRHVVHKTCPDEEEHEPLVVLGTQDGV